MASEELREDIKATLRRRDPDADDLRELASGFETLAERYDDQDDVF